MSKPRTFYLLFAVLLACLLASAAYYIIFQDSWFDESYNSYQPWLTAEGFAFPYQDFVEKHPPISFYLQVGWQWLWGPSILAYRILAAIFLLGLAFLLFDNLRRVSSKWIGLFGLALLVFHPYAVSKFVTATPDSLIAFFSLLSLWFLLLKRPGPNARIALSSIAMALAFLGRYNMLPALFLLWFFALFYWRSWSKLGLAVGASVLTIGLLEIPYLLLDAEYSVSFFMVMFGPLASLLPLDFLTLIPDTETHGPIFSFLFNEGRLKLIMQVLTTFFHLWLLLLAGFILALIKWKNDFKSFLKLHPFFAWSISLVLALGLAHFLFGPTRHKMYVLYFLPYLLFAAGYAAHLIVDGFQQTAEWPQVRKVFIALAVALLILSPVSVAISGFDTIFFNRWDYADSDLARVARGGQYLATLTSPQDLILTIDNPDHVLLAGRFMIPERIGRHDTYTDSDNEALLKRFSRYNTKMFLNWLLEESDVFVAQRGTFASRLEPISGGTDLVARVENILGTKYELIGSVNDVYPRKEYRSGVMDIYRRKSK